MEIDWNFQELITFEQDAPNCTWMLDELMTGICKFKFVSFLIFFKNLIRIHLNFYSGLLRVGLLKGFDF
jgi:hypothetical protein